MHRSKTISLRAPVRLLALAVLAIATVTVVLKSAGADSNPHFTAQEFLEPIKYLASDQLKGRGDGTPELDTAADYLAAHFKNFGLKPGGDNATYLQHFSLVVGAELGPQNSFQYQQGAKTDPLQVQQSFIPAQRIHCGLGAVVRLGVEQ